MSSSVIVPLRESGYLRHVQTIPQKQLCNADTFLTAVNEPWQDTVPSSSLERTHCMWTQMAAFNLFKYTVIVDCLRGGGVAEERLVSAPVAVCEIKAI
jgi:hypothetical protein